MVNVACYFQIHLLTFWTMFPTQRIRNIVPFSNHHEMAFEKNRKISQDDRAIWCLDYGRCTQFDPSVSKSWSLYSQIKMKKRLLYIWKYVYEWELCLLFYHSWSQSKSVNLIFLLSCLFHVISCWHINQRAALRTEPCPVCKVSSFVYLTLPWTINVIEFGNYVVQRECWETDLSTPLLFTIK